MPLQYDRYDRGMAVLGSIQQRKTSALFKLFDSNADGLGRERLRTVRRPYGSNPRLGPPGSPERERVSAVYSQIWDGLQAADSDGDGRVTLEEALDYQEQNFTPEAVSVFAQVVFSVLDGDGDGEIGLEEYRQYLATASVDTEVADETFPRLDANGDGRITQSEWDELFREYFLSDDPDAPGSSLWGPF